MLHEHIPCFLFLMKINSKAADIAAMRMSPASDATKGITKPGSLFFFDLVCVSSSQAPATHMLGFPSRLQNIHTTDYELNHPKPLKHAKNEKEKCVLST